MILIGKWVWRMRRTNMREVRLYFERERDRVGRREKGGLKEREMWRREREGGRQHYTIGFTSCIH